MSSSSSKTNAATVLACFRDQQAAKDEPWVEVSAIPGACFVFHPTGCDQCSIYLEHLVADRETHPSKYSFLRNELLDSINNAWPIIGDYINDIEDEWDTASQELAEQKSENDWLQEEIHDLLLTCKLQRPKSQVSATLTVGASNRALLLSCYLRVLSILIVYFVSLIRTHLSHLPNSLGGLRMALRLFASSPISGKDSNRRAVWRSPSLTE